MYIQSNIIYNFEDLKSLLIDKAKEKSYYLLNDDIYFEKIEKNTNISREVYIAIRNSIRPFNVIKYIIFKTKEKYSTKEIYELIQVLNKTTIITVTLFNQKTKEVTFIFVSSKDDVLLEKNIKDFLELEE